MDIGKKLDVLARMGKILNEKNIIWAVGGSLLLLDKPMWV